MSKIIKILFQAIKMELSKNTCTIMSDKKLNYEQLIKVVEIVKNP